jgi:hypothetical protein
MVEQTEHDRHLASSPSRPGRPRAGGTERSGSRRSVRAGGARSRRPSECQKSLQAPGFDRRGSWDRGGECVQEEGGYEYASYHHGGEDGEEEDQVEEGLLYQPLEAPSGEKETKARGTVSLCADAAGKAPEPCARFTSAWGFIESFGHEAEDLYHKGKRFVHKLLSGLKVHAPSGGDYACAAFGVGVSYALTDSPFLEQATIGALSGLGCASVTH